MTHSAGNSWAENCRGVLFFLIVLTLIGCASEDRLYAERFDRFWADPANFAYSPMEPVQGSRDSRPLPVAAPGMTTISASVIDAAEAYAAGNNSSALLVWRRGKLEAEKYFGDIEQGTLLNSKSLAKPLTAIVFGRAIQLGIIESLDSRLADYLPALEGSMKGEIRIRHLLDMRAGLLEQSFSRDRDHPTNRAYLSPRHDEFLACCYPMTHEPGERYGYANAPSEMVALVVEAASGRRYSEFVSSEVLQPIDGWGGDIWINREGGVAHSGCCIRLPAQTWLRLAVLLLQDGVWDGRRLLPEGYVAEMRRGTEQNPSYGLGVWLGEPYIRDRTFGAPGAPGPTVLQSEPYLDPDMFYFDGNASQTVHISPQYEFVVLRMGANPPKSPQWDNSTLPNMLIRGMADAAE